MKDNPYYLGNQDCPPTQFIFETAGRTFTQELPWDISGQDICHAFYVACSSICDEQVVIKTMYAFGSKELLHDSIYQCKSFLVDPCIMTIRTGSSTTKIELTDKSTGVDLCKAFHTLCLGITFMSDNIYEFMRDYAESMLPIEKEEGNE